MRCGANGADPADGRTKVSLNFAPMTTASLPAVSRTDAQGPGLPRRAGTVLAACALLVAALALSMLVGADHLSPGSVWQALTGSGTDARAQAIVQDTRLPRTIAAVLAGAGLAMAGAVIQALTRNPLADPGLLGVSAGSSFAIAIAVGVLGITATLAYLPFAFLGAVLTTAAVFVIGGGSASPARLTLAGVSLTAVLTGITGIIVRADPKAFDAMRAWNAGSLENRRASQVLPVVGFVVVGILLAFALTGSLNAAALGDDTARALGADLVRTRLLALVVITLLAGSGTAVAGPILFVGLMIPHLARRLVGVDQRWIMLLSMLLGPSLLLVSDVLGRLALPNGELPVGIVTAFVGAPVLIAIVRARKVRQL